MDGGTNNVNKAKRVGETKCKHDREGRGKPNVNIAQKVMGS